MHRAIFPEDCYPNPEFPIAKGEYLVEDLHAAWFLGDGLCTLRAPETEAGPLDPGADWNGKRVLIGRAGGIGDLLFMTPVAREIRRRWPRVRLDGFALPEHAGVLANNPDLDGFLPYPITTAAFASYDARIWLEGAVEKGPGVREIHAVDLFAARAGIALEDRRAVFRLTEAERTEARKLYPRREGKRRLGIQLRASTPVRTYPPKLTAEVIEHLHGRDWEIYLFGAPGQVRSKVAEAPHFVSLPLRDPAPTLRESAAILETCDVFLGPDSGLIHIAGALNVPTVALYAAFPWQIRTAYAPSIVPLTGHLPCAPCFHHSSRVLFPADGPCRESKQCDALAQIAPGLIVETVESLAPRG